ncbi:hypothetical protein JKA73_15665 [Myxococcus xanthus]|uniref:hypothetical protein n=1 Tax=Myxococcus xanthus TaxID=34 RepID=UPI001917570F|nr:hypothetical protein [Myxococcus xanthus]QQR47402.1 hypothetical protein JKA73_15665 [Myxococcus xanthus]
MGTDIYLKRVIKKPSREHIIPNFLGGRLVDKSLIDASTNTYFSDFEALLAEELRFFIVALDARSHRLPDVHPPALQVTSIDGQKLVIDAKRGARVVPGKFEIKIVGREVTISGVVSSEVELRRALERQLERAGVEVDIEEVMGRIRPLIKSRLTAVPPLKMGYNIWSDDAYRATAKIAFNMLGRSEPELALRKEFDAVRQFILDGSRPSAPPVEVIELDLTEAGTNPLGPLDHMVMVRGDSAMGTVTGFVTYFGVLSFAVRLADCVLGGDFSYSYRVNQLGGNDRENGDAESRIEVPSFQRCAQRDYEQCVELTVRQTEVLYANVRKIQRERWIEATVGRHWKSALAGASEREMTEDEMRVFVNSLAHELSVGLFSQVSRAFRQRVETAKLESAKIVGEDEAE